MLRRGVYRETPETKIKREFLKLIRALPYNSICADCPCDNENYIRRANSRLGIFLCFYCARTHVFIFGEGSEIFASKPVDKRVHEWTDQEIKMMLSWSNLKANAFWGGKMTEEQATEEGRIEFIRAKYLGRKLNVPELSWYANIEIPLYASMEGTYPFDNQVSDDNSERVKTEMFRNMSALKLGNRTKTKNPIKTKHAAIRKVSVSSSESDEDINKMLEEVVRDYTATHSRTTRSAERPAESHVQSYCQKDEKGNDLISFD